MFLGVVFAMFLAFGISFNVIFSTDVQSFGNLRGSLLTMFRGCKHSPPDAQGSLEVVLLQDCLEIWMLPK